MIDKINKEELREAKKHLDKTNNEHFGYVYDFPSKVLNTIQKVLAGKLLEPATQDEIRQTILSVCTKKYNEETKTIDLILEGKKYIVLGARLDGKIGKAYVLCVEEIFEIISDELNKGLMTEKDTETIIRSQAQAIHDRLGGET